MNLEDIKSLIALIDSSTLSRVNIKQEGFSITIERQIGGVVSAPTVYAQTALPTHAPQPALAAPAAKDGEIITSPMVGTFYRSPSPDSPMFANVGERVAKGKPLCILEAMKIFNEVEAEFNCTILEILVEDGQVVEYDTPLFRVRKE
ncbi:acetyl-CoA carboxylase biotin carboxyl carrier protein [Campylobacterota bacterium]|nr:acetyl-CoA carboxylase biotin carboxyl carrier protein [Campylobacterota bacterium]